MYDPRVTHPYATLLRIAPILVRLACVKRAASVDSEPGSNSRLKPLLHLEIVHPTTQDPAASSTDERGRLRFHSKHLTKLNSRSIRFSKIYVVTGDVAKARTDYGPRKAFNTQELVTSSHLISLSAFRDNQGLHLLIRTLFAYQKIRLLRELRLGRLSIP